MLKDSTSNYTHIYIYICHIYHVWVWVRFLWPFVNTFRPNIYYIYILYIYIYIFLYIYIYIYKALMSLEMHICFVDPFVLFIAPGKKTWRQMWQVNTLVALQLMGINFCYKTTSHIALGIRHQACAKGKTYLYYAEQYQYKMLHTILI